jgi:phosphoesterase RecJ-like protein
VSRAVRQELESAGRVLIVCHRDPDGDALGSSLGLMHLLEARGRQCWLFADGALPPEYGFLPGLERVSGRLPAPEKIELAVLLDCHEPRRAGPAAEELLPRLARAAVVDHHRGEPAFGQAVWVDPEFAATSEMLAVLAAQAGWELGPEAAACLFTGLMTDTGSFRYANASPRAFRVAAELVEAGADPWAISQEVYATRPKRLKLLGRVLENLELAAGGRLALGQVALADLAALEAEPGDLEDAVEALRGVPGVETAALLRELDDGGVKVSLRSRGATDVSAVARALGGGGHKSAAGARLEGPLAAARQRVAAMLARALEQAA